MPKAPLAKNDFESVKTLYNERLYYATKVLTPAHYNNLIDLWSMKYHDYGKVNLYNQKVRINSRFLKELKSDTIDPLFAVNFVADAFGDLRRYCRNAAHHPTRIIPASSKFANVDSTEQNRWKPLRQSYEDYLKVVFDSFVDGYMQSHEHKKRVTNVDTFLNMFLRYAVKLGPRAPVTKVGYIESRYAEVNYNGLMIEVAKDNHGDDLKKWEWIQDLGFDFWVRGCAMHGFWVDRNAPWRIVANLESKSMGRYMEKYNIVSINDFFNVYCVRVFMDEIRDLKVYLYRLYAAFLRIEPYFYVKQFLGWQRKTVTQKVHRVPITEDSFYRQYNDRYWMQYWFWLRMGEVGVGFSSTRVQEILKTAYRIQIELDLSNALEYLTRVLHRAVGYGDVAEKSFVQRKRDRQIIVHS